MKEYVVLQDPRINLEDNGSARIETDVQIRILNRPTLKAVAKITYAGLVINDIKILEKRGNIDIVFPQKPFGSNNNTERMVSVVFPCVPELSSQLNHIVLKAYSEAMLENQNEIINNSLS